MPLLRYFALAMLACLTSQAHAATCGNSAPVTKAGSVSSPAKRGPRASALRPSRP